jgi:threonine synthase
MFKCESANPTHFFTDCYAAVTVSVAKSLGFKKVVVSSTGSYGAAVAASSAFALAGVNSSSKREISTRTCVWW